MYKLAAVTQVCDEPFPTLFYAYTPIVDPSGGRSFPSDDIASAALAAAALTAPGGNPARLEARDLEREITLMLELNLALKVERLALDDVTVFHIWQDGQERGRILVAPGNLAPGVRVYLALPEPGKTTCQYYLDPGWTILLIPEDGGHPRARIYRADPATGPLESHPAVSHGKRGLRRRGPPATPDERKVEIVTGWFGATSGETQESYCNRVGIGVSTLGSWIRELNARGLLPEDKQ